MRKVPQYIGVPHPGGVSQGLPFVVVKFMVVPKVDRLREQFVSLFTNWVLNHPVTNWVLNHPLHELSAVFTTCQNSWSWS